MIEAVGRRGIRDLSGAMPPTVPVFYIILPDSRGPGLAGADAAVAYLP